MHIYTGWKIGLKERTLENFVIPRKAFRQEKRLDLPMIIRWTKKGAEIDPALLTPENVQKLHDELFGAFMDEGWTRRVHVYEFYRVSGATQDWRFKRTDCLCVCVLGHTLKFAFRPPHPEYLQAKPEPRVKKEQERG